MGDQIPTGTITNGAELLVAMFCASRASVWFASNSCGSIYKEAESETLVGAGTRSLLLSVRWTPAQAVTLDRQFSLLPFRGSRLLSKVQGAICRLTTPLPPVPLEFWFHCRASPLAEPSGVDAWKNSTSKLRAISHLRCVAQSSFITFQNITTKVRRSAATWWSGLEGKCPAAVAHGRRSGPKECRFGWLQLASAFSPFKDVGCSADTGVEGGPLYQQPLVGQKHAAGWEAALSGRLLSVRVDS